MISAQQLDALDPQTRQVMLSLMAELSAKDAAWLGDDEGDRLQPQALEEAHPFRR